MPIQYVKPQVSHMTTGVGTPTSCHNGSVASDCSTGAQAAQNCNQGNIAGHCLAGGQAEPQWCRVGSQPV